MPTHRDLLLALALVIASPAHAQGPLCPARVPELFPRPVRVQKAPSPRVKAIPVQVGDRKEFWTWDFSVMPPGFLKTPATCRAAGNRVLIFVEDSEWGTTMGPQDIALLFRRFEQETPAGSLDPQRGIGALEAEVFGEPPLGLDGEPRVILLFFKMATFNGSGFDGYYNAFDTLKDEDAQAQYGQRSNEAEILYLNTRGSPPSSDYMVGVVAHELEHLIHHPHDAEEKSWVDESLAEAAMVLCGYPIDTAHLAKFVTKPETPLVTESYVSYGACFLFGTYLLEQLGPAALGVIVRDPATGADGLTAVLASRSRGTFPDFFGDWAAANLLGSAPAPEDRHRYRAFGVPALTVHQVQILPAEDAGKLEPHRLRYIGLPVDPVTIKVTLELEPASAWVRLNTASIDVDGSTRVTPLLTGSGAALLEPGPPRQVLILQGMDPAGFRLRIDPVAR